MENPIARLTRVQNMRSFFALLLSYMLVTTQLMPLAIAATGPASRSKIPSPLEKTTESSRQDHANAAPAPVPVPLVVVPNITVTKTDNILNVNPVTPGDTITYSITVSNSGTDATNVVFDDTVGPNTTIIGASVKSTPIAFSDAFNVLGNVRIQVPDGASDLLANDIDPDTNSNSGLTITTLAGDNSAPFSGTSLNGGQVTAATGDGSFAYNPAPGFTGFDTFTYTTADADGGTSTQTVTLTVSGLIWFVNAAAGGGGDGRLSSPFNCLTGAGCFDAVAADDPGDNIFLYVGSYTGGLTLIDNQKLIGQGASSSLDAVAGVTIPVHSDLLPPLNGDSSTVTLTTSLPATNGINLAVIASNTLRGFTIGNTTAADIASGASFGTLTVSELTLNGTGRTLNLTNGTLAATFQNIVSTSSPSGAGVSLSTIAGNLTVVGTVSVTGAAGQGIAITGSSLTAAFGATTISSSITQGILITTSTGNMSFGNTAITGGTDGVSLQNNSSGTRSFGALSTANGTGVGFLHAVGGGAVTVSGQTTITNPAGRGIDIQSSVSAVTFANTNVLQTGGTGVFLGANSGPVTFADLDINPDAGQRALQANQNTGAVTSTSGTATTTSALAVEIVGISAANRTPLNIQFDTISANGSNSVANGLVLTNTSATGSPGGFRVNGTGTTDGSGGTIQNTTTRGANINSAASVVLKNMNFTNANSSVDGGLVGACEDLIISGCNGAIYLNAVTTATLDNLNITGTMVETGITAIGVSDFKLDNSLLDGCGDGAQESCVEAQNLSGTSTVNGTEIRFSETNSFDVVNTDVNLSLTINGSTFRDTQTVSSGGASNPNGEGGFQFRSFSFLGGTPTTTINVINSSFLRLRTQGLQVIAEDDTIVNIDIVGNTIDSEADIGTGIDLNANDTAQLNFNVLNNPVIHSRGGSAVNITTFLDSHGEGRVNNNASVQASGIGAGLRFLAQETSDLVVEARSNNVLFDATNTDTATIDAQARFQNAKLDVTLTNNVSTVNAANIADINLTSGSSTVGESNNLCANVATNTASGTGAARAFRARVSALTAGDAVRLFLEGFVEAGTATQDTEATWNAKGNTPVSAGGSEVVASLTGAAVGPLAPPGGFCLVVDTPTDFSAPSISINNGAERGTPAGTPAKQLTTVDATNATVSDITTTNLSEAEFIPNIKPKRDGGSVTRYASQDRFLSSGNQSVAAFQKQRGRVAAPKVNKPQPLATAPVILGDNVHWQIGTLPAGQSITITIQVTVDNPFAGPGQVSNQGMVTADGGISVLTDDPDAVGANNPTITLVNAPLDIFVRDTKVAEPASGTASMLFTIALSGPAPGGGVTVNYASASGVANPAAAGTDYTAVGPASVVFTAGQRIKSVAVPILADADNAETDETLLLNLTGATGGNIVDSQATGTITTANPSGTFLISELRTSGPNGDGDEFVELYNNTDSPLTVAASDASAGYGLFKKGSDCDATPILIGIVPNGTVIPARGHYLFVGSTYLLDGAAAGDQTMTSELESDRNVGVFSTADIANVSSLTALDAVGFGANTGGNCDLLREGTNLPALNGSTLEYSFQRDSCGKGGQSSAPGFCPTATPVDTNNNSANFLFADTLGSITIAGQRLGAPGPENLASPLLRNSTFFTTLLDPLAAAADPPNRVRDSTSDALNNSTFGTLSIRRAFTNNTGAPVTRLRFRIIEITSLPPAGATIADLRARNSSVITVTLTGGGTATVEGTTVETPPTQPRGGGFGSAMAAEITPGTPLMPGETINLQFLLGVQQTGLFRFFVNIEALP